LSYLLLQLSYVPLLPRSMPGEFLPLHYQCLQEVVLQVQLVEGIISIREIKLRKIVLNGIFPRAVEMVVLGIHNLHLMNAILRYFLVIVKKLASSEN